MVMISIKYSEIPDFLRNGAFFQSLSEEEKDGEIQVPDRCFVLDDVVNNVDDFARLLQLTAFWGLYHIPTSVISFCINAERSTLTELIGDEYAAMDFAQDLMKIFVTTDSYDPLKNAIIVGRTEAVQLLITEMKVRSGVEVAAIAAEHDRLDYLELLHQHGYPWDFTACKSAASGGCLECLQYLHENGCTWDSTTILCAAKNGHFECLKYAHEEGLEWHADTAKELAERGHLEMLKYAIERKCLFNNNVAHSAAINGHADCLSYLIEQGCEVDDFLSVHAATKGGYLNCMGVLIEHGRIELIEDTISYVAFWGHVHVVQCLHEKGCPWDWKVTKIAAYKGYFDVLYYAMEHGCECTPCTIIDAVHTVSAGGLQCLQYLIEQRELYVPQDGKLFMEAFASRKLFRCRVPVCKGTECDNYFRRYATYVESTVTTILL